MPAIEILFDLIFHFLFYVLVLLGIERYSSVHTTEMLFKLSFHSVFNVLVSTVAEPCYTYPCP
jgi:hypothetical protein